MSGILESLDARIARVETKLDRLLAAGLMETADQDDGGRMRRNLRSEPPDALLTRDEAMALVGVRSTSTWYRKTRHGQIPRAKETPLGKRWVKGDLEEAGLV